MSKVLILTIAMLVCGCVTRQVKNAAKESAPEGVEIVVTSTDLKVVDRAQQIMNLEAKWDRADNRECSKGASKISLYCALFAASIDVAGTMDHRSGALEEVRRTIGEFSHGKKYEHRLMDYNNDPSTTFSDIKRVLERAKTRIKARLQD